MQGVLMMFLGLTRRFATINDVLNIAEELVLRILTQLPHTRKYRSDMPAIASPKRCRPVSMRRALYTQKGRKPGSGVSVTGIICAGVPWEVIC